MINVIVAGAAGRMGCRLVALIKESTTLTLAGAIEEKRHHAVGTDAGETAGCGVSACHSVSRRLGEASGRRFLRS
jgi:4-hydroxy-tetrahydrodipicolinate reductase